VQVGAGFIVDLWPTEAGRNPPVAYQTALGINLTLQVVAFLWFVRPRRRAAVAEDLRAHPIHALAATLGVPIAVAIGYLRVRQDWQSRQLIARRQMSAWRSVALVSVVTTAAIGSLLLFPVSMTTTTTHTVAAQAQPALTTAHR
jgi:hypothetical protein